MIVGVNEAITETFDESWHCIWWYRLVQQHTEVWDVLHLGILFFGFDSVTFWGFESIQCVTKRLLCCKLEDAGRWKVNGWIRMALEKKCVSDCVSIVSLFIENEVAEWYFFWDFRKCCFENNPTSSHFTSFIAIYCIIVSLDSIQRSFDAWHDNIQWLALQKRSSLVLHIMGGNAEMKNDNFSRSRVI